MARGATKDWRGWSSDHARPGGKSSMGVLLDWLTAPGNYERWRAPAANKSAISNEIVRLLRAAGITHRAPKDVYKKIYDMEKSFHKAADKLRIAREKLCASKGSPVGRQLHRSLVQQSRYFGLLQPVMGEYEAADKRPQKRPLLTTRRTPPPTPTRPMASPKRKRTPAGARRTTPPRACTTHSSARTSGPDQKYKKPSPKRLRVQDADGEDDEAASSKPWETEAVVADEDSKAALSADIEMERAHLDLAMRRLEVQAARDKALVARVKARDELVEHGVPLRDVDRLLPLDI